MQGQCVFCKQNKELLQFSSYTDIPICGECENLIAMFKQLESHENMDINKLTILVRYLFSVVNKLEE